MKSLLKSKVFPNIFLALAFALAIMPGISFAQYPTAPTSPDYLTNLENNLSKYPGADIDWYLTDPDAEQFSISTPAELFGLGYLVNTEIEDPPLSGWTYNVTFEGKTINLSNDIDLSTTNPAYTSTDYTYGEVWEAIGWGSFREPNEGPGAPSYAPFKGTFDGNGYIVSGLADKSLFGIIIGAKIMNLSTSGTLQSGWVANSHYIAGVVNTAVDSTLINLKSDVNLVYTGASFRAVGGILSEAIGNTSVIGCVFNGTLDNTVGNYSGAGPAGGIVGAVGMVDFDSTVTVKDSVNYADLMAALKGGGIVGGVANTINAKSANIVIENSVNYGNITDVGTVNIVPYASGGILGASSLTIASDMPMYVTINNSANYGAVSGGIHRAGGIIGYVEKGNQLSITNSYNRGDVTSQDAAGGIVGRIDNADGAYIANTYDSGFVTGANSGGFVGIITGGAVDSVNNYYLETAASGAVDSAPYAGVTAESEAYMKTLDFVADLGDAFYASADDYPVLWPSDIEPVYELIGAVPAASVKQLNGGTNDLTVTVTETFSNGIDSYDVPTVITFSIKNNAAGTYDVGGYKVYVDTKGNTQVRECYIVK